MSEAPNQAQPPVQAGPSGEAAGVGLEVGVLHSSEEAPVTGAERRRGTCPGVSSGTWPMAWQQDTPRGHKVPNADSGSGGNAAAERDLESRIREIRPSGLMRGRLWRGGDKLASHPNAIWMEDLIRERLSRLVGATPEGLHGEST